MKKLQHGVSIGINRIDREFFLTLKATGKLTHEDYKIISPMIDSALEGVDEAHIKVFIDASEFEGWELRAAWDDFKLGLKHGREFTKVAIVGNKQWQKQITKIAGWFVAGDVRSFDNEMAGLEWLKE